MCRCKCSLVLSFLVVAYLTDQLRAQTAELTFTVAPGLSLTPITKPGLVKWPVVADWDQQGRLVVVESAGVAKPIEEHNQQLLHRIVRLIDENQDGQYDRRMVAADKLPFAEGVLCLGQDMLVAAPPHIWKLTDADGDGYCEQREIWFDGQTLTGCANDLHGPYLGRDGWIYWCKGAFARQRHELVDGQILEDSAAHIYRRRWNVNSSAAVGIEPVMSGGMDNPVEVAILPNGERFFTSTFLVHPGDGKRDGVAHAIYGGAYGKDHSALQGVTRTGSLMPIMTHLGAAAPSGLLALESTSLLQQKESTLIAALFNLQKVVALPLTPFGSTYSAEPIDLVVGSRIDFHPTDVLEDADGSLIVVDTGGWYDLCCPTSKVDQQTAAGGLYRLTRLASELPIASAAVNWQSAQPADIVKLLDDARPWIARRALLTLAANGDWAVDALRNQLQRSPTVPTRIHALWALGAIGSPTALAAITDALSSDANTDQHLSQAACHLIALHRHRPALSAMHQVVVSACESKSFAVARAAIEALGKIGDESSVELLFGLADLSVDRVFDHSLRYALFELQRPEQVAKYLSSTSAMQCSLALSTLDLLGSQVELTADVLLQATQDADLSVVGTSLLVKRIDLIPEVMQRLSTVWSTTERADPPRLLVDLNRGWHTEPQWQEFVARLLTEATGPTNTAWRSAVLKSMSGLEVPVSWHAWILELLEKQPLETARLLSQIDLQRPAQQPLVERLLAVTQQQSDGALKREMLVSLPARPQLADAALTQQMLAVLADADQRGQQGTAAWACLRRLKVERTELLRLIEMSPQFAPTDLMQMVELVSAAHDDALDQTLWKRLADITTARALPAGALTNLYRQRGDELKLLVQTVVDQLSQSDPQTKERLAMLDRQLPKGDPVRGLTLFHSAKANCGACHQMGYRGGKIGPELSRIGGSRTRQALLEAIVLPSERIEQGYSTQQVLTSDGRVFNGIVVSQSDSQISLRVAADKIETLSMDEIEEQKPSELSIMPGGLRELLSDQELADLLSLLEAAK